MSVQFRTVLSGALSLADVQTQIPHGSLCETLDWMTCILHDETAVKPFVWLVHVDECQRDPWVTASIVRAIEKMDPPSNFIVVPMVSGLSTVEAAKWSGEMSNVSTEDITLGLLGSTAIEAIIKGAATKIYSGNDFGFLTPSPLFKRLIEGCMGWPQAAFQLGCFFGAFSTSPHPPLGKVRIALMSGTLRCR